MPDYSPLIVADLALVPNTDGYLVSPPIIEHVMMSELQRGSESIVDGRYNRSTGAIEGVPVPIPQDTYLYGTAGRTGYAFDATTGASDTKDDWKGREGKYGLMFQNAALDSQWEWTSHAQLGLKPLYIVIGRGVPIPTATHTPSGVYAYLELTYGQVSQNRYRLAMKYGSPIALEVLPRGSSTWQAVATTSAVGNLETYLGKYQDQIRFFVKFIRQGDRRQIVIELGSGHNLVHACDDSDFPTGLNLNYKGKNGWTSLEVYPVGHQPITITKKNCKTVPGSGGISVSQGGITDTVSPDGTAQSTSTSAATDNDDGTVDWNLEYGFPDDTGGYGSYDTPVLQDAMVSYPGQWIYFSPFGQMPGRVAAISVQEDSYWDVVNRIGGCTGHIVANNYYGNYDNWIGNYTFDLWLSNGQAGAKRVSGIMGSQTGHGAVQYEVGPILNIAKIPFTDTMVKLRRPLGQRIILDGLCVYTAIRYVLEICGINPFFMQNIPNPGLPPYPANFYAPILGKGTGLSPRYEYAPDASGMSVVADLVRDLAMPFPGNVMVPFMFWQDQWRQYHFEPWLPGQPVAWYSTDTITSDGQVSDFSVEISSDNLRTDVIVQGQDALTYELLHAHYPLTNNIGYVGFPYPMVERNARYVDQTAVEVAMANAVRVCSLPTETIRMRVHPFNPYLFPGCTIGVSSSRIIRRWGIFTVTNMRVHAGMSDLTQQDGRYVAYMDIEARSVESDFPA